MGRKTLKIAGYTTGDIKELIDKEDMYKVGIKLYAIYQVSKGQSSRKLEELYNTSFKQIINWVHRFEKQGINGLLNKPKSGRKSKLAPENLNTINSWLTNSTPEEFGYNTATWTGPILIELINKEMGVTYKKAQIYNILKALNFTHKKAKGYYPEVNKYEQERFKEDLKKTTK